MIEKQAIINLVEKLKSDIRCELNRNNNKMALELIYSCANILYQSNIYYVDDELEAYVRTISNTLPLEHPNRFEDDTLLFYDGFGLNDRGLAQIYLNALCKYRKVIYVTYEDRKDDIPDLLRSLNEGSNCKSYFIKRNGSDFCQQIISLNEIINIECPHDFFFYSIPNDVVGTTVMNSYDGLMKRYQVNLTDHAFWLGAKCIDKCIEFRDYGASVSKKYRLINENSIVKLPFYPETHPEREFQGFPFDVKKGQKVVFSGGSLYKTLGGDNKYYKIIEYILSQHEDVIFWYAGKGDDTELKKILDEFSGRAYHTSERQDLFQVLENSRFYLSTYPICGGLMYQFAASAGKVPVTLKYGEDTDGFLINQKYLGIEFDNLDDLYAEVDRLITDDEYCKARSREMLKSVMDKDDFESRLKSILDAKENDFYDIEYTDIQTDTFRNEYLKRLDENDLNACLANKETLKSSLKHEPVRTIRGGQKNYKENSCDISIIVVTYNSRWDALVATLDSILKQIDIDFEIIVADDGSEDAHFELLNDYFAKQNFKEFKLIKNKVNRGTVCNIYSGLVIAKGDFVKVISPGDMLYKADTLRKWIDFMKNNDLKWSFSEVIPYRNVGGTIKPSIVKTYPRNISVYRNGNNHDIRWQYFVLSDLAVGASVICCKNLQLKYMEEILDVVIYAEDNIWRSMMFDGIVGIFYDEYTILYEYGSGVSTSKNNVWIKRLREDWDNNDRILSTRNTLDDFQLKMWKAYNTKGEFKALFVKDKLKDRLFHRKRKSIGYLP